jgi:Mrp family chromosome partitioning ATPase
MRHTLDHLEPPVHAARGGTIQVLPDLSDHDPPLATPCMDVLQAIGWPERQSAGEMRTLGVTSVAGGEGVSTISAHLAATAASYLQGPVLLVDCNVVRPAAHTILGVPRAPGLTACAGGVERALEAVRRAPPGDLFVLPAGELRGSPARLYGSAAMGELIPRLAEKFALSVFDLPPSGQASCLAQVAARLDGLLLVIRAGRVTRELAQNARARLEALGAHLVGAVLNQH